MLAVTEILERFKRKHTPNAVWTILKNIHRSGSDLVMKSKSKLGSVLTWGHSNKLGHSRSQDWCCSLLSLNCGPLSHQTMAEQCLSLLHSKGQKIRKRICCCYSWSLKKEAVHGKAGTHMNYLFSCMSVIAWPLRCLWSLTLCSHFPDEWSNVTARMILLENGQWHMLPCFPVLLIVDWAKSL